MYPQQLPTAKRRKMTVYEQQERYHQGASPVAIALFIISSHPFSVTAYPVLSVTGVLEPTQAVLGKRRSTRRTSSQFIAGPNYNLKN